MCAQSRKIAPHRKQHFFREKRVRQECFQALAGDETGKALGVVQRENSEFTSLERLFTQKLEKEVMLAFPLIPSIFDLLLYCDVDSDFVFSLAIVDYYCRKVVFFSLESADKL